MPHIEYMREAGSEGIELVMWLIARGAMADLAGGRSRRSRTASTTCRRRNTAVGHLILENRILESDMTVRSPSPAPARSASSTSTPCKNIDGVEVVSVVGRELEQDPGGRRRSTASRTSTTDLADSAGASTSVDAVDPRARRRRCTPSRRSPCLKAGKHVQVEIPLCRHAGRRRGGGRRCRRRPGWSRWCGHTRRFNPSHQWVHKRIDAGELNIQQMDVQTYFFRRTNMNALGQPRSWTDHLLWHHAAHTVDLFAYQTGEPDRAAPMRCRGRSIPKLGIAMDMSIQLKAANGAICTLSLSFNNDGPLGTFFRYIGDTGTYIARYDDLVQRQGRADRRVEGRRVDERHRAAGPRVLRRDPRGPRAERQRRPGARLLPGARPARTPVQSDQLQLGSER